MYVYDTEYPRGFGPRKDKPDYKALEFCADLLILSRFTYKHKIYHLKLILVRKTTLFIRPLQKISEAICLSYLILLYRTSVM